MILTCPNCGTQYVVKDGAVPPQGRQVRCAACKHSWHQDPEPQDSIVAAEEIEPAAAETAISNAEPAAAETAVSNVEPADEAPFEPGSAQSLSEEVAEPKIGSVSEPEAEVTVAEAAMIEPRTGPEAEERAYEEAVIGEQAAQPPEVEQLGPEEHGQAPIGDTFQDFSPAPEPRKAPSASELLSGRPAMSADAEPYQEDEFSPFAERDTIEPRGRNPFITVLMLVIAIAALAAAFWFLAPSEWKARIGMADPGKTPLELMITHPDRQKLASGQESLTIAGRVINPTDETHSIPPIYAQLKSRTGQVIYSWTIAPPAPSLGPRASASFNSTEVSVPSGGEDLTITLGSPKA